LTFVVGFGGFELLFFSLVFNVAVFELLFIPDCEVLVFVNLGLQLCLAIDDLVLLVVSHLVSFHGKVLHLSSSVINDFLELVDLSVQQVRLILMGIFQKS
jgi:hypothetical protein